MGCSFTHHRSLLIYKSLSLDKGPEDTATEREYPGKREKEKTFNPEWPPPLCFAFAVLQVLFFRFIINSVYLPTYPPRQVLYRIDLEGALAYGVRSFIRYRTCPIPEPGMSNCNSCSVHLPPSHCMSMCTYVHLLDTHTCVVYPWLSGQPFGFGFGSHVFMF